MIKLPKKVKPFNKKKFKRLAKELREIDKRKLRGDKA